MVTESDSIMLEELWKRRKRPIFDGVFHLARVDGGGHVLPVPGWVPAPAFGRAGFAQE